MCKAGVIFLRCKNTKMCHAIVFVVQIIPLPDHYVSLLLSLENRYLSTSSIIIL